jgi:hypothetical protein
MSWIYYTTSDNKYRYALGEVQENANRVLFCFGINPSKATPKELDPTAKRIKKIAEAHGYDSWIILNICPQISTNPNGIAEEQDFDIETHKENLKQIAELLNRYRERSDILFAYGDLINKRPYLKKNLCEIINIIKTINYNGNCYCLGNTKSGNARHPLYQKADTPFVSFSLNGHTYSEIFYLEDNKCIIRECAENGALVRETWGFYKST